MNIWIYIKNMKACMRVGTQKAHTRLKRCSKSLVMRELRIEIMVGITSHRITLTKTRKLGNAKCKWWWKGTGTLPNSGSECGKDKLCGKQPGTYIFMTQQFSLERDLEVSEGHACGCSQQHYLHWGGGGREGWCGRSLSVLTGEDTVNCGGGIGGVPHATMRSCRLSVSGVVGRS